MNKERAYMIAAIVLTILTAHFFPEVEPPENVFAGSDDARVREIASSIGQSARYLAAAIPNQVQQPRTSSSTFLDPGDAASELSLPVPPESGTEEENEMEYAEEKDYIDRIAGAYCLDPNIVRAIIAIESNGDPNCVGDEGDSFGLMQIQPYWHEARMQRLGVTDLFNAWDNVTVGCDYLAELLNLYDGDYRSALTCYNAGSPYADTDYADRIFIVAGDEVEAKDE